MCFLLRSQIRFYFWRLTRSTTYRGASRYMGVLTPPIYRVWNISILLARKRVNRGRYCRFHNKHLTKLKVLKYYFNCFSLPIYNNVNLGSFEISKEISQSANYGLLSIIYSHKSIPF